MELDAKTVVDLWESIKDHLPIKSRAEVILNILEVLQDNDVEISDHEELKGVDDDLDEAYQEVYGDLDEEYEEWYNSTCGSLEYAMTWGESPKC